VHQLAALRDALNPVQREAAAPSSRTGMPDRLKGGLESLSGFDLSDVRVHYNSSKPAQLNAQAYTQGKDIHVASGQEHHVPHEGWHAVQQMQGRVRATTQLRSTPINDESHLEREADLMGARALQFRFRTPVRRELVEAPRGHGTTTQRVKILNVGSGTNPDNLMQPGGGDTVVNVDSGHMAVAELLMSQPVQTFEALQKGLGLPFKESAFKKKTENLSGGETEAVYKQFIIRALFEKFPGMRGFETMLATLEKLVPGLSRQWKDQMYWLHEEQYFEQGFVEDLSNVVLGLGQFDEIHAISALGFDLFKDPTTIEEMVRVLKPGGKLIVTAEKSGMVAKAMKFKKWDPVLEEGKPVIRQNLPLLQYFDYLPDESAFGNYQEVFKERYPDLETEHTTGRGFEEEVPFARLVFELKDDAKDELAELEEARYVPDPDYLERLQEFALHTPESEFDAYEFF